MRIKRKKGSKKKTIIRGSIRQGKSMHRSQNDQKQVGGPIVIFGLPVYLGQVWYDGAEGNLKAHKRSIKNPQHHGVPHHLSKTLDDCIAALLHFTSCVSYVSSFFRAVMKSAT